MVALLEWGAKSLAVSVSGANPHHGIHSTDVDLAVSAFARKELHQRWLGPHLSNAHRQ